MHPKFVKVAAPIWASTYIIIFYLLGAPIILTSQMYWGIWVAMVLFWFLLGIWGTIFYLILLQSDLFEHLREKAGDFLRKRKGKVFQRISEKYFAENDHTPLSPATIMLIFLLLNPLVGVPLIRYTYHKKDCWKGILWIWVGSFIKVATWYFPIYGGGTKLVLKFIALIRGG